MVHTLYLLASLADELTSVGALVFVETDRRFVGVSTPAIVRERLAKLYAPLQLYEQLLEPRLRQPDIQREVEERAQLWETSAFPGGSERDVQTVVTRAQLGAWLGPYLVTGALQRDTRLPTALEMQRVIDWPGDFVPMVEEGRFVRMIDRRAMVEQVARWFVAEQVARLGAMSR